ncbi:hypothetical protein C2G38_2163529 [Gigaspora rosea]|uniref:Peptidase S1 domain-containing protein n=1 Tax=Gigaspora rosea TaxID=44941 RepID=A0A397W236_9GLOM|nr:hypothetical protein C2G38_2163529 [Gigaspora rosea]
MKVLYSLISLLLSLQGYSIYAQQNHPLAKLWEINDIEVPEFLERDINLIKIDKNLSLILEQDDFISSFGGTYIDLFQNYIIINTANNSMNQLNSNYSQIVVIARSIRPQEVLIYIDMEYNNIVLYFWHNYFDNTKFINAVKSFNPTIIYDNYSAASQNIQRGDNLVMVNKYYPDEKFIITSGHCYNNDLPWENEFYYLPRNSKLSTLPYIGPMTFNMIDPYDFGIGEDVAPTVAIRNTDANQYKELIISDGLNGFWSSTDHFTTDLIIENTFVKRGDSGGPVCSFVSSQNLNLVVVHGIIVTIGSTAQSIETIFDTIKEKTAYEQTLYHEGS